VTRDQFRKLALRLPEAAESAHMAHPDFRVRGKIFATLGYPDDRHAMVKLTPGQQADCMDADPSEAFAPAAGKWGQRGATTVLLKAAKQDLVRSALEDAWRNVAPKKLVAAARKS
jgi:hypothetical protein